MTTMEKMIDAVGYWEASDWGASVMSYEIVDIVKSREELFNGTVVKEVMSKIVRYYAIEHGEEFYFDITLPELYQKYQDLKAHGCA